MPVIDGVGQSQNTKIKLAQLSEIFKAHVAITNAVMQKNPGWWSNEYLYIDATAGPGIYEGIQEFGSPLSFANVITSQKAVSYKSYLIDVQPDLLLLMSDRVMKRFPEFSFTTCIGKYEDVIPIILKNYNRKQLGLVYIDPNNDPNLDTVKFIAEHNPHLEILIYVAAANMKRIGRSVEEFTKDAKKHCWLIREPQDTPQWTFMLGTTWILRDKFKKIGMYPIDSTRGKKILERCALTHKEIKEKCKMLQAPLIALTENTLNTRNS